MISWYVIVAMLFPNGSAVTMKAIYDTEAECIAGAEEFRKEAPPNAPPLDYVCKREARSSK